MILSNGNIVTFIFLKYHCSGCVEIGEEKEQRENGQRAIAAKWDKDGTWN